MADRFSLLVVEDDPDKRRSIISALHGRVGNDIVLEIQEVADYQSARDALKRGGFDFVIMDLRIPAGRGEPSERWSRVLMQDIVNGELCYPMHIFGLTQYKDFEANERELYNQHLFGFYLFDRNDDAWANQIANKITYIASALQNGAAFRLNSFDYDLLILTARHDNEFIPIKEALFGQKGAGLGHPLWKRQGAFFGALRISGGDAYRAALLCVGETGLAPTAAITSQAISVLRPRMVAMLGMCAGFADKNVKVMDVLIARSSACWQEGKMYEKAGVSEIDLRGKIRGCSRLLSELIDTKLEMERGTFDSVVTRFAQRPEYISLRKDFSELNIPEVPSIHSGIVISGSAVVADSKIVEEARKRFPPSIGLEMEIFGMYTAVEVSVGRRPEFVAIKTASDFGTNEKKDHAQRLASALSAEVFKELFQMFERERNQPSENVDH